MMALRMVRSFRATATRATSFGFPACTRRSRKALSSGLKRAAVMAAMNRTVRTLARPPLMKLRPRQRPRLAGEGGKAGECSDLAPVKRAELGQLGEEGAGDHGPDAWGGDEEALLLAPDRRAAHLIADLLVE